jgi:hypothetical protein
MAQPSIRLPVKRNFTYACATASLNLRTLERPYGCSTFICTGSHMIITCSQEATVTAPKIEHYIQALFVGSQSLPTTFVFFNKKQTKTAGRACTKNDHNTSGVCESGIWRLTRESGGYFQPRGCAAHRGRARHGRRGKR